MFVVQGVVGMEGMPFLTFRVVVALECMLQ